MKILKQNNRDIAKKSTSNCYHSYTRFIAYFVTNKLKVGIKNF